MRAGQDSTDHDQLWLQEIEKDSVEAAQFEFENIRALTDEPTLRQRKSGLVEKLLADPSGKFKISRYSTYQADHWILDKQPLRSEYRVKFNSGMSGGNELKKILVYHLIPEFHPLGRLKSFCSTVTYSWAFGLLEEWLFKPNALDATPSSIKIISSRLINDALDKARDGTSARNYFLFYFIITFWQTLSANELIPANYSLDVSRHLIDTAERQKDVQEVVASEHKGWQAFTEDELGSLVEYALFWIEEASPKLLEIKQFLLENGADRRETRYFIKSRRWAEFEDVLGQKMNGVEVCGFTRLDRATDVCSSSGDLVKYPVIHYRWVIQYKNAVDRIRDAILIMTALVMGMRKRELSMLKFDDVRRQPNGEWVINITRFKTTLDPAYFGKSEEVPLPAFIGESVEAYQQLRSFDDNMRSGLLFEQVSNSRKTNFSDRAIWRAFSNLGEHVGVPAVHPHRFRKTIAEILINRSERNIDLIRLLFGHKSYVMTLRYIARNPYLVHSVAETLEANYTEAFLDIVSAVQRGEYSGIAADRIAKVVGNSSTLFKGTLLRIAVFNYISHLLEAGDAVFIKRVNMGMFCVSIVDECGESALPCWGLGQRTDRTIPDPGNCSLECNNLVVLAEARGSLEKNITFYSNLLEQNSDRLTRASRKEINRKIAISKRHLDALNVQRHSSFNKQA
ncbi:tyrosine-type recombinase/integrase [Massilia varians]